MNLNARRKMRLKMCNVLLFTCCVHNNKQMVAKVSHHQVVHDAALLISKESITLLART